MFLPIPFFLSIIKDISYHIYARKIGIFYDSINPLNERSHLGSRKCLNEIFILNP